MKRLRWQILVVFLALIAIGVLLLSQEQPRLSGEETVDQPVAGGSYSEALIGAPLRLNPLLDFFNQVDHDVDRLVYSSLVRFDERDLPHGELAETWGISKDGTKYSFSIRKGATWHDGMPVTSQDVVFTINLLKDPEMPVPDDLREFWNQIQVFAPRDDTLQFQLPEAFSPFLGYLTFGVLPKHLLEGLTAKELIASSFNLQPVGSGAFRFKDLEVKDGKITAINLEAYPGYYGNKPFIQEFVFHYYPSAETALAAYDKGDVKGVSYIPTELLPRALSDESMSVFTGRLPDLEMIFLNNDSKNVPFFKDKEIRRALLMGINRQRIINRLLEGQAIEANAPIFPESWAFYGGVNQVTFDQRGAIELLKKAGYTFPADGSDARSKDGVALRFTLLHPDDELSAQIAKQIQGDWAALGVIATLKPVTYQEMMENYLQPRTYDAALAELDLSLSPDPDPYPFWHQAQITSGQNYAQWDDRQVSEYLEQARVMDDFAERTRRYRNFQVRFATELPSLPLFFPTYSYGVNRSVSGVSMGPLHDPSDRFNNLYAWFLKTAPKAAQVISTSAPGQ